MLTERTIRIGSPLERKLDEYSEFGLQIHGADRASRENHPVEVPGDE